MFRKHGFRLPCLSIPILLVGGLAYGKNNADTTRLKVIAEGSLSNRQAFGFVTCHFTLAHGKADTEDEAVVFVLDGPPAAGSADPQRKR